jgi:hypothetical protein
MIRVTFVCAVLGALLLGGCNQAKSPDKVDADVAKATADAQKHSERAEERAERTDAAVTNDLANDVNKANAREARAAADDAVVQAEGENKIALAKCESLAGDAQKACRDQANAQLDLIKQRAKALKRDEG